MRKTRLHLLIIYVIFNVSFYCPLSLPLRCLFQGRLLLILLYPTLSLSLPLLLFIFIFLSIALTRSIYHGTSGFLVVTPLRPWPIWVPEQEQPIAHEGPFTAPITPVHARKEMQPVHIAVPRRPDPDHWGVHSDKSSGDWICDWHDGHGSKEYPQGTRSKE